MQVFLTGGLKDNTSLAFSVLTGILRVAKEGIFSGLNNLFVCPITSEFFDADFGFSEQELVAMLDYYGLDYNLDEVRSWYDGYTIGKQQHVYNPWSITSFVKNNGKIAPYWVNTSENLLIQDLIKTAGPETKMDFEGIVMGKSVQKEIIDGLVFQELSTQPLAVGICFWRVVTYHIKR